VTPASTADGTPTGTVTFTTGYDPATVLGTAPVTSSGGAFTATLTTSSLFGGGFIQAIYSGDSVFSGSTGAGTLTVQQATANVTLGALPSTSYYGDQLTFTVNLAAVAPGALDPSTSVEFWPPGGFSGTVPLVISGSTGTATFTTYLAPGTYSPVFTLSFPTVLVGPTTYPSITILPDPPTATTVAVSPTAPVAGLPMTVTATVSTDPARPSPIGAVTFYDGAATLGTATLTPSGAASMATLTVPAPAAGGHLIRAIYRGASPSPIYPASSSLDGRVSIVAAPGANYNFNGAIAADGAGNVFMLGDLGTTVLEFGADGTVTTVASGFYSDTVTLSVDPSGNLFIAGVVPATNTLLSPYQTVVYKWDGKAVSTIFAVATGWIQTDTTVPMAVDGAGNVYVVPWELSSDRTFYEIPTKGPTVALSTLAYGVYFEAVLAADRTGQLFVGWGSLSQLQPDGSLATIPGIPGPGPSGLAVDAADNLFIFGGYMYQARLDGTYSPLFAGGISNVLSDYRGIALDAAGDLFLAGQNRYARVDMTPNLPVNALQTSDVQSLLTQQGGSVTIQPTSDAVVSNAVQAINGLSSPSSGTETITLDLGGGTFSTDTQIQAPAGVTVVVQNGTLVGGSPALVLNSGSVILSNVTARNATNAPTIVINGGSLKIRNSTIEESTGYAQAAIQINGGTVDLGTASSPGGNIFNVNGTGTLVQNLSGNAVPAVGDTFENHGVAAPSILVLNPTASGAVTLSGNAHINMPGPVIVESSSKTAISVSGNDGLSPAAAGIAVPDPFASLSGPGVSGLTSFGSISLSGNSQKTIGQGIYSQISVSGNAKLTLSGGTYIIEGGGLTVSGNAGITGSGVFIYNAGSNYPNSGGSFGGITLSGNGTFNLTALSTGTYAGLLIYQSRQNTRALSLSGNAMAGMTGTIYAANALLSMSGNAALQSPLVVGTLNLSGNVALTQTAAGSDGSGDTQGIANTLLAGNLAVYINDPSGLFTADELARIQDAINTWDTLLAPYNVSITEVSDPTQANMVIDTSTTSACGGMINGVLGCFNAPNTEITMIQGWNWYAGSDPTRIGTGQYDFETTMLHELGHALGLGGSTDPTSPMNEVLAAGLADRTVTVADLNIPDPPAGADPQMAAGFDLTRASASGRQNGSAPAPASVSSFIPAGPVLLSTVQAGSNGVMSTVCPQSSVAASQISSLAGLQRSLVVPGSDREKPPTPIATKTRFELAIDSALEALDGDRSGQGSGHGGRDRGTSVNQVISGLRDRGEAADDKTVPEARVTTAPTASELAMPGTGFRSGVEDLGVESEPVHVAALAGIRVPEPDPSRQPDSFETKLALILLAGSLVAHARNGATDHRSSGVTPKPRNWAAS
jgi:hypothetical protein